MATGKIANLSVGVSADTAEFTNGLSKAQAAADRFAKDMNAKSVAIGVAIGQNIGQAAQEIALAFPRAFSAAVDSLDAFNDLKDATSASIENISALDAIGRRTGATFEDVSSTLLKFNKTLGDAGDNVKGDIFRELGLDLEALKKADPAEAFRQTAVALAGVQNNATKSQVLLELFGKSAGAVAAYLNDVGEAGEFVAAATTEQAEAAETYNKALFGVRAASEEAMRSLVSGLLPVFTEIIKALGDSGTAVSAFGSIFTTTFQTVAVVGSDVGFVFLSVGREIGAWAAQLAALGSGDLKGFKAISEAVKEDGERARKELDAFQQRMLAAGQEATKAAAATAAQGKAAAASSVMGPTLTDPGELDRRRKAETEAGKARAQAAEQAAAAQARSAEAARKYIDAIQNQIFKAKELTEVEKVAEDMARGRVKFASAAQAGAALDAAAQLDASKRLASQLDEEAKVWDKIQESRKSAAAEIEQATISSWDTYNQKLKEAQDLQEQGYISATTLSEYTRKLGEEYVNAGDKAKESADLQTEAAKEAERSIQQSLGSELSRTLAGDFENIGKRWGQLLLNMAAQAAAADLVNSLFGKSQPSQLGALFGVIGSIFTPSTGTGFGTGSGFGNQDFGAFLATGTNYVPYDGFKATLHEGEAVVPKKFNPSAGGSSMGGGDSFFANQTINVGAGVSLAQVKAEVNAANAQSEERMRRQQRQQRGV